MMRSRLEWRRRYSHSGSREKLPHSGRWYPAISWVRDDGFYAVCIREQLPYQDACRLFGFDIPEGKPSVPKRIKRDVARGKTSLFGELLETRELNQWDRLHTVLLADGKTTFEVATYNPGDRWPGAWTSGAALVSPRGGIYDFSEQLTEGSIKEAQWKSRDSPSLACPGTAPLG